MLLHIKGFVWPALRLVSLPPPLVPLNIVVGAGVSEPGPALSMVTAGSAPALWLINKVTGLADQR
jgi:hypothetical protein